METIFRFIKHCDDCEKWPKDHWKKKKYYFQAATTMSKLMKAPKLSAWSMINAVGSPLTSLLLLLPLDISRGSHPGPASTPCYRRRAGHGSMSARARGAPPCKKYNLERGNRPSIQLPTPSPIISFITWMLHGIFGFETLKRSVLVHATMNTMMDTTLRKITQRKTEFNIRFKIHQILKHSPLYLELRAMMFFLFSLCLSRLLRSKDAAIIITRVSFLYICRALGHLS